MTETTKPATRYEVVSGVAWFTIDRPEARNAANAAVRADLREAVRRFNADDDAHVLVLTGAGDQAFCAGGDLKEMAGTSLGIPTAEHLPHFGHTIPVAKPTIAAVNGLAYAGGFLLAQMCDLCIAVDHARFAITEVKVGRGAPWAAPLPWLMPPRVAMELLLTGDPIDATRAHQIGLVNAVVSAAELRPTVQALGERIAANAPLSVRAAKEMVYRMADHPRTEAFTIADEIWNPVYLSQDAQEGPLAFAERRTPQWTGR